MTEVDPKRQAGDETSRFLPKEEDEVLMRAAARREATDGEIERALNDDALATNLLFDLATGSPEAKKIFMRLTRLLGNQDGDGEVVD